MPLEAAYIPRDDMIADSQPAKAAQSAQSGAVRTYRDLLDAVANEPAAPPANEAPKSVAALDNPLYGGEEDYLGNTVAEEVDEAAAVVVQAEEDASEDAEESAAVRKGRPRSEKSRKAILKAVNTLLLHTTVQDLSIEAIAKKAKVGKTTIYRWWPNKTAVVMDALINQPGMQTPLPTASSHAEAIEMQLDKLIRLLSSNNGQIIAQLFSEAQADEQSLRIFNENFLSPLMDAIQYSLECGKRDGEFRADLDVQMAIDMLCGPVFFRLMAHPQDLGTKFQYAYPPSVMAGLKK